MKLICEQKLCATIPLLATVFRDQYGFQFLKMPLSLILSENKTQNWFKLNVIELFEDSKNSSLSDLHSQMSWEMAAS